MIKAYLENEKVQELLKEIINNPKYYDKNQEEILKDEYVIHSRVLLLFYDALYKYSLIIEDTKYLDEFLNGFESLIKKLKNIEDINYGLSRLIGKITCKKLDVLYDNVEIEKVKVLRYIHDKYVKNGYYIRGLTRPDYINICNTGVIRGNHFSYVDEISDILKKYDYNLYDNYNELEFNTDISKACIKSINSPEYLYKLVINDYVNNKDVYYLKDKEKSINNLKVFLDNLKVNKADKKDILELFNIIWDYFNKEDNNIYLVLIKRSKFNNIDEYKISNEFTFDESLDNIFNAYDDLEVREEVKEEIDELIELPSYYKYLKDNSDKDTEKIVLDNEYGMISVFMIIGTILILFGVIISLIFV
ncbi:MAG: hypothetical protein Q4E69_02475 [Bacilli bacterium]|nr:hypothetical protein [Bacilli bacterium]